MRPHYHVTAFQSGCLNDYDSGPHDTLKSARADLQWYLSAYRDMNADRAPDVDPYRIRRAGKDRYEVTQGSYSAGIIVKVEPCENDRDECDAAAEAGY
jgi:hypothetical protein